MHFAKKLFVGGNWKCNNTLKDSRNIVDTVLAKLKFNPDKVDVAVFPNALHITEVLARNSNKGLHVGSQNISPIGFGAFTGETSHLHLSDLGIHWTLIGHSERRQFYGETDEVVANKTKFALDNKFGVVLCVGESLAEREGKKTLDVIGNQLQTVNNKLGDKKIWKDIVIAYEPVWAIGTGKVATPDQAQEVHKWVRGWLTGLVGEDHSNATRIIYGGSVTEKNCKELIEQPDIDGFLVGGASLKPAFIDIVDAVAKAAE